MFQGILDVFQFEFMRNALAAGVLVSIACGIIGTYVVVNRVVFISGGIAHSAYGGIGIGYFLGVDPVIGAILFSLASAFGMGYVQRKTRQRTDTIIGVMWAVGMAIGIVFIDKTEGYKVDLMSYLFGSILTVPAGTLWIMLALNGIILALVAAFYKELLAMSFDETFARIRNVPVDALYYMLLGMIALTVVMLMRVVGLILVIALLTIPAAVSNQWVKNLEGNDGPGCAAGDGLYHGGAVPVLLAQPHFRGGHHPGGGGGLHPQRPDSELAKFTARDGARSGRKTIQVLERAIADMR